MADMRRLLLVLAVLLLWAPPGAAGTAASLVDDSGRRIVVKKPFTRIICLYPAHTENLYAMGLGHLVIGVPPRQGYPPPARGKPVFSYRDDPERFLAAGPDLILIRPMIKRGHPALVRALEQAGVTVVSFQPRSVEQMYAYWEKLGLLTGHPERARALIRNFKAGLARIREKVSRIPREKRPRVFFESIHRHMKTFSPRAIAIFALTQAGGVNLAADARPVRNSNIAAYGKERILALAERMDVYLAQVGTMNKITRRDILRESGFQALKAVRQGRVYLVDERIVSRPTPRLLEGIRTIHRLLYSPPPGLSGQ